MTKKRFKKLMMSNGFSRNDVNYISYGYVNFDRMPWSEKKIYIKNFNDGIMRKRYIKQMYTYLLFRSDVSYQKLYWWFTYYPLMCGADFDGDVIYANDMFGGKYETNNIKK